MRNLVICCDGTWNTLDQREQGVPVPTNVVKLFNAVAENNAAGVEQLKYYHPGVGTEPGWWERTKGGATGAGLDRNIMSAYHWLCRNYRTRDRIYMFGFSRGAYTVRSLAGLVSCCGLLSLDGLPPDDVWRRVERVFDRGYRQRDNRGRAETIKDWKALGWTFHKAGNRHDIPVHLVGVWDTVGALGIPDDLALLNLLESSDEHAFHDVELGPAIRHARHAVALDEIRASFQPTLWTGGEPSRVKQVWFPGVHSDVGGGYRETGLSDIALEWMISEAAELELGFAPDMTEQIAADHRGVLHDSYTDMFKLLPNQPRSAPDLDGAGAGTASLHPSVGDRRQRPPITHAPYRPTLPRLAESGDDTGVITVHALFPWNETGLYLERGVRYRFEASGEWLDRTVACGPDGANDGDFQITEAAQLIGTALGELENFFRKFTGNDSADFRFTKRHERLDGVKVPWFCLVGAIANGGKADAAGRPSQHEAFKIGSYREYTPGESGYFYAYANDAWNFYENNRGSVALKVTRL